MEIPSDLGKASIEDLEKYILQTKKEIAKAEQELIREIVLKDEELAKKDAPKGDKTADEKKKDEDVEMKDAENNKKSSNEKKSSDENKDSSNTVKGKTEKDKPKDEKKEQQLGIWKVPEWSIPMRADVRTFDFDKLIAEQRRNTGKLFDVIMTDPPWQLATSNPTRGVAIGYQQLSDTLIEAIPFHRLQENGYIFIWVINAKYRLALDLMSKWGYDLVDEVVWVKSTVNRRLAKSHGFYLQHAKETCLVGKKGNTPAGTCPNVDNDIIYSVRRGQSQKPVEIYEMIERLVPNGHYLEIFARRNNLRNHWASIGNEL